MSYPKTHRPVPIEPAAVPSLDEIEGMLASTSSLPDRIYGHLKRDLLTGRLKPGSRMIEKNLCERFGVSRTPLRESLNRLAHEGLLLLRKNCGFTAAPLDRNLILRAADLRMLIEPGIVRRLAELRSINFESELSKMVAEGNDATDEFCRSNAAFHGALARCYGNPLLTTVLMRAIDRFQLAIYLVDEALNVVEEEREHQQILETIRKGEADEAERLMHDHLKSGTDLVIRFYS